jgi:hypothetical protein
MRCIEEIPLVLRAEQKHKDQNLTVLWVGHQDKPPKLTEYAKKNNIPDYLFDPDDSMSRKFGMTYGGGVVFINRDAVVKARVPKGISSSSLEAELKKILN